MQHKLRIHHALAAIAILVVGTMSFRSRGYDSDLSLISWMLVVVAVSSACASWFFRARLWMICLLSGIVGSAVTWFRPSIVGCLNCFRAVRSEGLANGKTYFIDSSEHVALVATTLSIASILFGGLIGFLMARYREWIKVNVVSFSVLVVATLLAGSLGYEFGEAIMPRVSRNLASLICASVGLIFSGAWIGTNRPFVTPEIVSGHK